MAHQTRLSNVRVLVFGGTSGIGFGVANMALAEGAYVTISGSRQPKVDEKVKLLRSYYPKLAPDRISGYAVDLKDTANVEKNLTDIFEKVTQGGEKKIDHIAFTAGDIPDLPKIPDVNAQDIAPGFSIRFTSTAIIAKLLSRGKYMPVSPTSSLTLTGGTNTQKPMPGWSLAAGWGGAVEGLSRGLAVDLAPIRVNMVEPGAIQTELLQRFVDRAGEEALAKMRKQTTLTQTLGQPSDTAEAYGWFMKDRFVTGTIASTNGGRMLVGEGLE